MNIKYLFLDFDGVFIIDGTPEKSRVEKINSIIKQCNPKIYLITMWQAYNPESVSKMYKVLKRQFGLEKDDVNRCPSQVLEKEPDGWIYMELEKRLSYKKREAIMFFCERDSINLGEALILDDFNLEIKEQIFLCDPGGKWLTKVNCR